MKITGGDDNTGLPMKNGVLTDKRVRLLLAKGSSGYRCTEKGIKKRKSVRGCIVSDEISVLSLIILKVGDNEITGLTDVTNDVSHLPKRANKLRRMFDIPKGEDIVTFIRAQIKNNSTEETIKYPKIRVTRVISKLKIERKKRRAEEKVSKKNVSQAAKEEYYKKYFNKV